MWGFVYNYFFQIARMPHGERPSHSPTPIMGHEKKFFIAKVLSENTNILNKILHSIFLDLSRFSREIIATHIRSHSLIISPELGKLIFPFVPKLRKAVEEHYQLAFALSHIVQANIIDISVLVLKHDSLLAVKQTLLDPAVYLKHRRYV